MIDGGCLISFRSFPIGVLDLDSDDTLERSYGLDAKHDRSFSLNILRKFVESFHSFNHYSSGDSYALSNTQIERKTA